MPSISFMPINMSGLPNRMWRFMVLEEASRSIRGPEIRSLSGVIKAISKRRSMLPVLQCIPNPHSWKTLGELLLCRKSSELSTLDVFLPKYTDAPPVYWDSLSSFCFVSLFCSFFSHRIIWFILDLFIGINERNEYKLCNINEQIKNKVLRYAVPQGSVFGFPLFIKYVKLAFHSDFWEGKLGFVNNLPFHFNKP